MAAVQVDSPAEMAGIRKGDCITKMDESAMDDFASVAAYLSDKEPGQRVAVTVLRENQPQVLNVKLKAWTPQKNTSP